MPQSVVQVESLFPDPVNLRTVTSRIELATGHEITEEVGENLSFAAASSLMRKVRAQAEVLPQRRYQF